MQHHDRGATGVARDLPVNCVKLGHLQHPSGVRLGGWVEHLPQGLRRLPQDGSLTMSPSHSVTLKNVLQVQGKVGQSHLQQTGRASYSSWTGKAGHSAQSKTGLVNAAQAQVAAGCSTPCQSQHGRDKKALVFLPPQVFLWPDLSAAKAPAHVRSVFGVRCAKAFPQETTTIFLLFQSKFKMEHFEI